MNTIHNCIFSFRFSLIWDKCSSYSTMMRYAESCLHSWVHIVEVKKDLLFDRSLFMLFSNYYKSLTGKQGILTVSYHIQTSVQRLILYNNQKHGSGNLCIYRTCPIFWSFCPITKWSKGTSKISHASLFRANYGNDSNSGFMA